MKTLQDFQTPYENTQGFSDPLWKHHSGIFKPLMKALRDFKPRMKTLQDFQTPYENTLGLSASL